MKSKCSNCGIQISQGDVYCRQCGKRIKPDNNHPSPEDSFHSDILNLLDVLKGFRSWIDRGKKTNIRFMKTYKKRLDDLSPLINEFKHKYSHSEPGRLEQFDLVDEIFSCYRRPVRFMETKLRPSVGMGVWQERWMMTAAVEDYLKACCREADRLSNALNNKLPFPGKLK